MTWTGGPIGGFQVGAILSAAQMNNLQADITASADGDSGAPNIQEAAMAAASVNQAALKSTTAENSSSSSAAVTLTGGQYAFLINIRNSGGFTTYAYGHGVGTDTNVQGGAVSYENRMSFEPNSGTGYIRHRYVQACPPYEDEKGNLQHLFAFIAIRKTTGEIIGTSIGIEAPWHNNGPTYIRTDKIVDGVRCREQKDMRHIPFTYNEAKSDTGKLREYAAAMLEAEIIYEPITQELKRRDMPLLPDPGFQFFNKLGKDITKDTVTIMLDPVCDLTYELAQMQVHKDFSLAELLHEDRFVIDNDSCGRCGPPGILVPSYRWKLTS